MERIAQSWRAKPGMAERYRRDHATVWPELEQLFRDAGVRRYEIYIQGDMIFSFMEVEDYRAFIDRVQDDPVATRWDEEMAELIDYEVDPATGWPPTADLVWAQPDG